jgi:hypothetical protein
VALVVLLTMVPVPEELEREQELEGLELEREQELEGLEREQELELEGLE